MLQAAYVKGICDIMKKYDNVYISGIRSCYERFVINNEAPSDDWNIDPDILESWKRSKAYGIDVNSPIKYDLTEGELDACLEENHMLVETALPYIQHISNVLEGTHFVIVLTDEKGHVLETFADKHPFDRKVMEKYNMRRGAIRRECFVGTDSIALAIELRKPVEVYGEEHFLIENHTLVCTTAPIFISGKMIGTLTIMGPREMYQRYTMGMVCAIVDGIEKEIKLKNINDSLYSANDILRTAIENIESGIFVLDEKYDIQQYNQKAVRILNVNDHERLRDMNFFSIIERMSIPERIRDMKKVVHDVPVTLTTQKGMRIDVSMSISLIQSTEGALKSIIVSFKKQADVNKMASSVIGSNAKYTFESIIGDSALMREAKHMGNYAAESVSNVLIQGESGTGKELMAQAIHNASDRARGPFVAVNCGSIPKALIESELFGYESGAFTGARKNGQVGKFELADGGTIFLDEIGDMPLELQVSLLRVLQNHEVTKIGGTYPKTVDVKVIASTNVDLLNAIERNNFRGDLYYRLNVLNIRMPSLRERKDDIPVLAEYFIETYSSIMRKKISGMSDSAVKLLKGYSWPGNVRELENVIERAVNLAHGDILTEKELPVELKENRYSAANTMRSVISEYAIDIPEEWEKDSYEEKDRQRIKDILIKEKGDVKKAAEYLEMPLSTVYRKLKKYNMRARDFKL